jgi:hypothetical protein
MNCHADLFTSGIYDQDYLDYMVQLLKKCQEYGLQVYIDPHQDCVRAFIG